MSLDEPRLHHVARHYEKKGDGLVHVAQGARAHERSDGEEQGSRDTESDVQVGVYFKNLKVARMFVKCASLEGSPISSSRLPFDIMAVGTSRKSP